MPDALAAIFEDRELIVAAIAQLVRGADGADVGDASARRAVGLVDEGAVHDLDLPLAAPALATLSTGGEGAFALPEGGIDLEEVERHLVRQALTRTGGNKSRAARLLGLSRATLRYRLDKMSPGMRATTGEPERDD